MAKKTPAKKKSTTRGKRTTASQPEPRDVLLLTVFTALSVVFAFLAYVKFA